MKSNGDEGGGDSRSREVRRRIERTSVLYVGSAREEERSARKLEEEGNIFQK